MNETKENFAGASFFCSQILTKREMIIFKVYLRLQGF
jgi:hypothetical protein